MESKTIWFLKYVCHLHLFCQTPQTDQGLEVFSNISHDLLLSLLLFISTWVSTAGHQPVEHMEYSLSWELRWLEMYLVSGGQSPQGIYFCTSIPLTGTLVTLQCLSSSGEQQKTLPSPKCLTVTKASLAWEGGLQFNFMLTWGLSE